MVNKEDVKNYKSRDRVTLICDHCGTHFHTLVKRVRSKLAQEGEESLRFYCSNPCSRKASKTTGKITLPEKQCPHCKNPYTPNYKKQKYCSKACTSRATAARRSEKLKTKKCDYGCGGPPNYRMTNGKYSCSTHYNSCPAIREKNSRACKKAYKHGRKPSLFTPEQRAKSNEAATLRAIKKNFRKANPSCNNKWAKKILIEFFNRENKCEICSSLPAHMNKPLTLHLDHKNGDNADYRVDNLRLLCPNCHSQTPTYCGKNIDTKKRVSDEDFISAFRETPSIRAALIMLGLTPKGRNYNRAYKLKSQYNIIQSKR